jgi:maltose alpha-D-glucosyltransferase/alpha-amylase
MQWSAERNAGFSSAESRLLYLPVIVDAVSGYQSVNVEEQLRDESSLLNWLRRYLSIRRQWPVFGDSDFEVLDPSDSAIFAFTRTRGDTTIVCVSNLSSLPGSVELDLHHSIGRTPMDLAGDVRFPPIGEQPYLITLPAHGFCWLQI